MKQLTLHFFLVVLSLLPLSIMAEIPLSVKVVEPFLEFRTGPAEAYPIFYVAQRDEIIQILKSRTHWFKVVLQSNLATQKIGWIHAKHLAKTLATDNQRPALEHPSLQSSYNPKWAAGFAVGRFSEADIVSLFVNYQLSNSAEVELHGAEYFGANEDGWFSHLQLNYAPYSHWRASPFVSLGYGYIDFNQSLIQQADLDDTFLQAGSGINIRIGKRYRLRFEYKHFNVLTSTNDNQELESWHLAFSSKL